MDKLTIENALYDERDRAREYLDIAGVMLIALNPVGEITLNSAFIIEGWNDGASGLTLVKTLIEGHGGRISVVSQVGVGSTFTLRLPILGNPVEMLEGSE